MPETPFSLSEPAPRRFGPSARALRQRRALVWAAHALLLLLAALLWRRLPAGPAAPAALAVALGLLLWSTRPQVLLRSLRSRELSLHAQALELRRGAFKRFVVFEAVRHIHVVQGPRGERLLSLRLDTDDDSLMIRDMDGLPEAFAALAGAKSERSLIEIEERRVDWGEPLPWALGVAAFGAIAGLCLLP